jgi:formylglycine-generating enzyme
MLRQCVWIATLAVTIAFASFSSANVFQLPSEQKSLEFVTVNDVGNPADATGLGSVGYAYQIGTYDVTAAQYVEFLNAVARTDTYGLYWIEMSESRNCNIQRRGVSGSYTYSVDAAWANRPVNFTSFGEAARFCNWLTNGQPTGNQDLTTTEDGSYYLNGITDNTSLLQVTRKADARYALPTENEWYKAAYYDSNKPGGAGYWAYPTRSDTAPTAEAPPGQSTGSANYAYVMGSSVRLTDVGAYTYSASPYGTFDQGGLLYQWTDTLIASPPGYSEPYCGFAMLSSSFMSGSSDQLRSDYQVWPWSPVDQYKFLGFRVAVLPDSSTVTLTASDTIGSTSFNAMGHWSNGYSPGSRNPYVVSNAVFRTPPSGGNCTFQGQSLSLIDGGRLEFNGNDGDIIAINSLTINNGTVAAGAGPQRTTFTLMGDITLGGGGVTFETDADHAVIVSAGISGDGQVEKHNSGSLRLTGANTYTGTTTIKAGTLELASAAQSAVFNLGGVDIQAASLGGGTISAAKLVFSGGVVNSIVDAAMKASYGGGDWSGGKFISSNAVALGLTLGWRNDGAGNIIVMPTYAGDFNLDGSVNLDDLEIWEDNAGIGSIWQLGDANYDGAIDLADLDLLKANMGRAAIAFDGCAASAGQVPEPSVVFLMATGIAGILTIRWMNRRQT